MNLVGEAQDVALPDGGASLTSAQLQAPSLGYGIVDVMSSPGRRVTAIAYLAYACPHQFEQRVRETAKGKPKGNPARVTNKVSTSVIVIPSVSLRCQLLALCVSCFVSAPISGAVFRHVGMRSEAEAALFHADEAVVANDNVVEQLDVEELASFAQLLGRAHILG